MDSLTDSNIARPALAIQVGRLALGSPLIIAAGPWSAGDEKRLDQPAKVQGAGALISKTVTLHPREGNPEPTVLAVSSGLLNRVGLRNPGIAKFIAERLPRLLALQVPVLVSVAAQQEGELAELINELEVHTDANEVVGYELNASCPNTSGEPPEPQQLLALVVAARRQTTRPLWVKLGYADRALLCGRARACAAGGADAIVAINTVPALAVSDGTFAAPPLRTREKVPFLGGLSGTYLHPLALRAVWELTHAQSLPVIGCGGVRSVWEALAFFAVGAQAIQLGSILYPETTGTGAPILPTLHAELMNYLSERGTNSLVTYLQEYT